jgi:hypothetical protein
MRRGRSRGTRRRLTTGIYVFNFILFYCSLHSRLWANGLEGGASP